MERAGPLFSSFPAPGGTGVELAPGHWAWRLNRLPWCHRANPSTTLNETVASTDADTLMADSCHVNGFFCPGSQERQQSFDRQSHDIGKGAVDVLDDHFAMFLNRVGARLVEGVDGFEIPADLAGVEGMQRDVGAFDKCALTMTPEVEEADPGDHLMGAILEERQHPAGVVEGGWFTKEVVIDTDEGISAEDLMVRVLFGDGAGLAIGVELAEFVRAEVVIKHLGQRAGDGFEVEAHMAQEFAAAGRCGGEDERGGVHGFAGRIARRRGSRQCR
jgi:hypothetical protein